MKKANENKGFTLAELLIVVAIIAVMVAIAIPTFSTQLEKAREATDISNLRSAYAQVVADSLENPSVGSTATVTLKQTQQGWQTSSVEIAGADLSGGTSPLVSGTTLTVVYTPASGTNAATITIAGVTVPSAVTTTGGTTGGTTTLSATLTGGTVTIAPNTSKTATANFTALTIDNDSATPTNGVTFTVTAVAASSGTPTNIPTAEQVTLAATSDKTGIDVTLADGFTADSGETQFTITFTVTKGEKSLTGQTIALTINNV